MLNDLSGRELIDKIGAGESTAEAAARACLDRIAEREPAVQAWAHLDPAQAATSAREIDQRPTRGPLHGMPVGIKDIIDTADLPSEYGSPIYAGHRPTADAACVALMRDAGAVVLGKTVTTEFATTHPGKTRNPHAADRTPGGSSSGSAAAVADRMVPVALGTQTMGSIIRPAAYCGVVGFKPSYGLINRAGIKPQAESLDTVGVIARKIDDAALVAAVLMGAAPAAFEGTRDHPPRILLYRGPDWAKAERSADDALAAAAERLAKGGATIEVAGEPAIFEDALRAHLNIVCYELARAYAFEWATQRNMLSETFCGLVSRGLNISFDDYVAALNIGSAARQWIAESFARTDLWMTMSAPGEAPLGMGTGDPVLNRLWSMLHVPVVTLPVGRGPANMPLGVQLIGQFRRDAELIRSARWTQSMLAGQGAR